MILAAIYPEKFEGEKGQNLMKVSSLTHCREGKDNLSNKPAI